MRALILAALALLCACGGAPQEQSGSQVAGGRPIPMTHARTFTVTARDGYRIVDLSAPIVTWGGGAEGPDQHARILLVPREQAPPPLTGDLAGATIIFTPAMRIAANIAPFEAMLLQLGIADRLVAVGGAKSWNDQIRARALSGRIAQIGYGWHSPPNLDSLIASRPDAFLMNMGDLDHTQHYDRMRALGVPVIPTFLDAEPDYMGRVDYVRLVGMITGREREADAFVAMVARNVAALRRAAAAQPPTSVISAWFAGGDQWMATVRNGEAQLLRDANARNLLAMPDDNRLDASLRIGTEQLLARGRDAQCWIIRDTHSEPFTNIGTLRQFRAFREGCLFASDGMHKPSVDAYDLYETGVIRPDLILGDLVRALHPALRDQPFRYVRPETRIAR